MFGVNNVLSSLKRLIVPERWVDLNVWLSPTAPRWDYTPVEGPVRIVRVGWFGPAAGHVYAADIYDDLSEAMVEFATRNLPQVGELAYLLDDRNTIIVGWCCGPRGTQWGGCQFGYEMLAIAHNPVDAAVWERNAEKGRLVPL